MLVPIVLTNALLCGLSARERLDIHVIAFSLVYGRNNEQSGLVKVYFGSTRNLLKEKQSQFSNVQFINEVLINIGKSKLFAVPKHTKAGLVVCLHRAAVDTFPFTSRACTNPAPVENPTICCLLSD